MILYCLIYASFLLDFLIFPIPSEASTLAVSREHTHWNLKRSVLWLAYAIILLTWLSPLLLELVQPPTEKTSSPWWQWSGFSLALAGRAITWYASYQIRHRPNQLVDTGLFSWSRHPIVCGLHLTLAGLLVTTAEPLLLIPYVFSLFYFDYKIDLEENAILDASELDYRQYQKRCSRYPLNVRGLHWKIGVHRQS